MENIRQRIITDSKGRKVFLQDSTNLSISFTPEDAYIVSEQSADDFTISELQEIISKTSTDSDTISTKTMETPDTEQTEQQEIDK